MDAKRDLASGRSGEFLFVSFQSRDSMKFVVHNGFHKITDQQIQAKGANVRP